MNNNGLVKFFANRVSSGIKLWTEVPDTWREATKEKLITKGYTLNDDGTVTPSNENLSE
jgi:hypothetical protein